MMIHAMEVFRLMSLFSIEMMHGQQSEQWMDFGWKGVIYGLHLEPPSTATTLLVPCLAQTRTVCTCMSLEKPKTGSQRRKFKRVLLASTQPWIGTSF